MSNEYDGKSRHNGIISWKPKAKIFGSSKQNPLKTDNEGILLVKSEVDIDKIKKPVALTGAVDINNSLNVNVMKHSLAESGKLFSFSFGAQMVKHIGELYYQISNPKNSGKTIKIQEIWATILTLEDAPQSSYIKLYKKTDSSSVSPDTNEIAGGYNMNFGFSDDHVARFSYGEVSDVDLTSFLSCTEMIDGTYQELFIHGDIVLPYSTDQEQQLLIVVTDLYTDPLHQHRYTPRENISIIWSEE